VSILVLDDFLQVKRIEGAVGAVKLILVLPGASSDSERKCFHAWLIDGKEGMLRTVAMVSLVPYWNPGTMGLSKQSERAATPVRRETKDSLCQSEFHTATSHATVKTFCPGS